MNVRQPVEWQKRFIVSWLVIHGYPNFFIPSPVNTLVPPPWYGSRFQIVGFIQYIHHGLATQGALSIHGVLWISSLSRSLCGSLCTKILSISFYLSKYLPSWFHPILFGSYSIDRCQTIGGNVGAPSYWWCSYSCEKINTCCKSAPNGPIEQTP